MYLYGSEGSCQNGHSSFWFKYGHLSSPLKRFSGLTLRRLTLITRRWALFGQLWAVPDTGLGSGGPWQVALPGFDLVFFRGKLTILGSTAGWWLKWIDKPIDKEDTSGLKKSYWWKRVVAVAMDKGGKWWTSQRQPTTDRLVSSSFSLLVCNNRQFRPMRWLHTPYFFFVYQFQWAACGRHRQIFSYVFRVCTSPEFPEIVSIF